MPSLHLEASSINQDLIVDVKVSCFFNMKAAFFIVDVSEDVMDVVVHCSQLVEPFFCSREGGFAVVVTVHSA